MDNENKVVDEVNEVLKADGNALEILGYAAGCGLLIFGTIEVIRFGKYLWNNRKTRAAAKEFEFVEKEATEEVNPTEEK